MRLRRLLALVVVVIVAWPATARADAPACPEAPPVAADDSSDVVVELRELRRDLAAECSAVTDRLGVLDAGTTAVRSRLGDVHDDLAAPLLVRTERGGADQPFYVTGPTGAHGPVVGSREDPAYVDFAEQTATGMGDGMGAINGAVYVLVGLMAIQILAAPLLKRLLP